MTRVPLPAASPHARPHGDQACLTVSLPAVQENYLILTQRMSQHQAYVAAVVKADAYGLGVARIAPALWHVGARVFFVATVAEALALRKILPDAALYVLSGLHRADLPLYAPYRLIPVLNQLTEIELWLDQAAVRNQRLPAAIHIDTGMGRLGLDAQALKSLKQKADQLKAFSPLLYMSHLANAEVGAHEGNLIQLGDFRAAMAGLPLGQASLANSCGCFLPRDYSLDLVRPGAALYGLNPTPQASNPMHAAIGLTVPILQTRTLQAGDTVGYGSTWIARGETHIATLSLGYADGLSRALAGAGQVFVDAVPCPLVGRVSMDLITINVSHLRADQRRPGTRVEIIGPHQSVDLLAHAAGTLGYEVLTALGDRFVRSYVEDAAP